MKVLMALLVFGSVWLWWDGPPLSFPASTRVSVRSITTTQSSFVEDSARRLVICAAASVALAWVLGGTTLAIVGIPVGFAMSWWLGRLESPSAAREREALDHDLATTIDLLAACAQVGRPLDQSLVLVARAMGGAVARRLDVVVSRLSLGGEPADEWRRLAADPQLGPLARTVARSLESGAPLVDGLSRLADDRRRERRTQTQLRARTVGVKAAGPLAACFLPAFMLIGVVPTIAGAFSHLIL